LENERLAGQGVLPFAFTALYSDQNRAIGSTILFVDVCSLNDSNSKAKDLVLSNTVAELVTIHDTKTQTDK
jgi:hypothetical protein